MWIGYALLGISVAAEAFFSDTEAFVKVTYKPTMSQMMLTSNSITFLITLLRLILNH